MDNLKKYDVAVTGLIRTNNTPLVKYKRPLLLLLLIVVQLLLLLLLLLKRTFKTCELNLIKSKYLSFYRRYSLKTRIYGTMKLLLRLLRRLSLKVNSLKPRLLVSAYNFEGIPMKFYIFYKINLFII